jgi:hypothetical protein
MSRFSVLCLALLAAATPSIAADRFSGSAALSSQTTQHSEDRRFALHAELQPTRAPQIDSSQRFALSGHFVAPKSLATVCGPLTDTIFDDGFE